MADLPYATVQAYLAPPRRSGSLLCVAVIHTADLYCYLIDHAHTLEWRTNPANDDGGHVEYRVGASAATPTRRCEP